MRQVAWCALLAAVALAIAGCGGKEKDTEASAATKAVCDAPALSAVTKLPPNWPQVSNAMYTKEHTAGPTQIVEGYYSGALKDAHDAYKQALGTNGYTVTDDELDEHDSEVDWKGHGRSGQVAIREQCGDSDKLYLNITNRPA